MKICGIDPGINGAIAFLDINRGEVLIIDMPVGIVERNGKAKKEISAAMIAAAFQAHRPDVAFIERVGAMPGQGLSSTWSFAFGTGQIVGVLAALEIETHWVAPRVWQKACDLRGGKDGGRLRAAELMPKAAAQFSRAKDNGRSDAALIAWYGATR
jgi:crossover junction endodeoxyribonuclease RuvC